MAGSDYSDKLRFCIVTASRSNLDRTRRPTGEEYRISNEYFSIYFGRNDVTVRSYRFFFFFCRRCRTRQSVTATGSRRHGSLFSCNLHKLCTKIRFYSVCEEILSAMKKFSLSSFRATSKSLDHLPLTFIFCS